MGFIQKIKDFFMRQNIKKLDAPKDVIEEKEYKKEKNLVQNSFKEEQCNATRIINILRSIGCKKEIISEVLKIENLDINNLQKNLKTFNELGYSKLQMNLIISSSVGIVKIENDLLIEKILELNKYIGDKEVVANIIYSAPFILFEKINEKIKIIRDIFERAGFDIENQKFILEGNPNIFMLKQEIFIESLVVLREVFENEENFYEEVLSNPLIIGIIDKNVVFNLSNV